MNTFLSPESIQLAKALAIIRVIIGVLLIYHGWEIADTEIINRYLTWEIFQGKSGRIMVYTGKSAELISGILLLLGLMTRVGAVLMICTFSYITFVVGHGRFWYEDQHPFLFVMFGVLFLFTGPGAWSMDKRLFEKK